MNICYHATAFSRYSQSLMGANANGKETLLCLSQIDEVLNVSAFQRDAWIPPREKHMNADFLCKIS